MQYVNTQKRLSPMNGANYELNIDPEIKLGHIESEVIGIKTELIKNSMDKYTLIIKSMKPKSQMVLFLNYDKIN